MEGSDVDNPQHIPPPIAVEPPIVHHAPAPAEFLESQKALADSDERAKKSAETGYLDLGIPELSSTLSTKTSAPKQPDNPPPSEIEKDGLENKGQVNPDHTSQYQNKGENPQDPNGAYKKQNRQGPGHEEPTPETTEEPTEPVKPVQSTPTATLPITSPQPPEKGFRTYLPLILKNFGEKLGIIRGSAGATGKTVNNPDVILPEEKVAWRSQQGEEEAQTAIDPTQAQHKKFELPQVPTQTKEQIEERNKNNAEELQKVKNGYNGDRLDRRF